MKKLVVTTTYNGKDLLKNLISDINSFGIKNEEICIVDNKSTDEEHLKYLEELKNNDYVVLYNTYGGFNIGGYKYALDNLKADVWFCMQDSIRIKQDIFSYIIPKLTDNNVYTLLTFPSGLYDDRNDITFLSIHYGTSTYSAGCFPHAYFAKDSVLQKVKNEWVIPRNKIEACGMERGAPVVFDKYGIKIHGLGVYDPPKTGDPNGYPFFYKIYGGRAH